MKLLILLCTLLLAGTAFGYGSAGSIEEAQVLRAEAEREAENTRRAVEQREVVDEVAEGDPRIPNSGPAGLVPLIESVEEPVSVVDRPPRSTDEIIDERLIEAERNKMALENDPRLSRTFGIGNPPEREAEAERNRYSQNKNVDCCTLRGCTIC